MKYIFTFLILCSYSILSQAGTIKGFITDQATGEPLIGAVVTLVPGVRGAVSGLDGSYNFSNVIAGTYTITAAIISFKPETRPVVVVENEVTRINFLLTASQTVLSEVTVRTKYRGGSEEQARSIEKNSDAEMNIMSARAIQLLPDITVANVLQRVSGVTVVPDNSGEGRYAVIRGMDKRYNTTLVNGIKIPSPDDKVRYVPMDIFPAELIERLEVIKALTPNMEGDAIGGVINMVMKNAPDKLVVSASAASGFNQTLLDRSFTSFNTSDVNDKDPYRIYGTSKGSTEADFPRDNMVFNHKPVSPNDLFSLTVGNRFLKKKLGVLFAGSYQNTFKGSSEIFFKPSAQPSPGNQEELTDLEVYQYDKHQTRIGLDAHADYELNSRNTITLNGLFVQLNEHEARYVVDTTIAGLNRTGTGTGPVDITYRSTIRKQNIANITLQGRHELAKNLKADWTFAYSRAIQDMPDQAELHISTSATKDTAGNQIAGPVYLNSVKHRWEYTQDQDKSGFLNLTYSPVIGGKTVEFMTGGMYRHKDRSNYYNEYDFNGGGKALYGNILTDTLLLNPKNDTLGMQPYNSYAYTVYENVAAGYIQGKILLMNKLQVLAGIRVEHTQTHYEAAEDPKVFTGQNGTFNYYDFLPSLHLKYLLDARTNIRFSYFRSITRPSFFEVVPYRITGEDFDEVGNYNLRHTVADNLDVRYELFPKGIDQLLIGIFYKHIVDPIEYSLVTPAGPSALYLQPVNPAVGAATNYGAEFQVTKYLHYFGVSANYTYTNSSINTTVIDYERDGSGNLVKNQVAQTRPLQGQSAHIGNISLLYKNPVIGLDAQIALVYTGPQIAFLTNYLGLNYWQKGLAVLDFSFEKRIVKRFSVYAKLNNLLNTANIVELRADKTRFVTTAKNSTYELPYQDLPNSVLIRKQLFGQNYLIGIRFNLNQRN